MQRRYQCQQTPICFRILVEVDHELLGAIDALAVELEESRQTLLGRFLEGGLKRERRRLRRQERSADGARASSHQTTANSRRLDTRNGRVPARPAPSEAC
jgi:hypothetical protein